MLWEAGTKRLLTTTRTSVVDNSGDYSRVVKIKTQYLNGAAGVTG
jgi:hypothetical protein